MPWWNTVVPGARFGATLADAVVLLGLLLPRGQDIVDSIAGRAWLDRRPQARSAKGGYSSVTKMYAYPTTRLFQRITPSTKSNMPLG